MTVLYVCITLVVGVMINLPVVMNAAVGKQLESPRVANGLFWTIGACSAIVIAGSGWTDGTLSKLSGVPLWLLLSGCVGATMLFAIAVLIPQIGAGNFKVLSALGAVVGGLVISHFGLLGTPQSSITPIRVIGTALMTLGASLAVMGKIPFMRKGQV
jgi:bacterial/archaeal transporter family-2 protein